MSSAARLPHVIPYQGSKRLLAARILSTVEGRRFDTLWEPFAGSAAFTIAAADRDLADNYVIADTLEPLVAIWNEVLAHPSALADRYDTIWQAQLDDPDHFLRVRDLFNTAGGTAELLYLLARCVKNAPRFNGQGAFNQSADKRRKGMRPAKMRAQIEGVASLLAGRASAACGDAAAILEQAKSGDLAYLDPPWEGTTVGTDKRYHQGLEKQRLIALLHDLNDRGIPYLLSYDGRCGSKTYGEYLPDSVDAVRLEIVAGRSSQATLVGRDDVTVESLYVSRSLLPHANDGDLIESPAADQPQLALTGVSE